MASEDSVDLDPEVLADPLQDENPDAVETETVPPATSREPGLVPADPFRRYLAELSKYPPLTREEEQELARRYRDEGDRDALFRLVTELMLVVRVAYSFRRAARNLLDLIQEGNLGLLRATERFDPELGVRLPTYAAWWVRAYMVKFLLDNVRMVRVGTTNARRKLLRNLNRERQRLEQKGFEVGPKLLAEHFGVSEEDVVDVQQALSSRDLSLDAPLGDEQERPQSEVLPDTREIDAETGVVARRELQDRAEAALAGFRRDLNERERLILDRRILSEEPLTLQALGDQVGTTREAIRQGEARLMKKLREYLKDELGDLGQIRIGPD